MCHSSHTYSKLYSKSTSYNKMVHTPNRRLFSVFRGLQLPEVAHLIHTRFQPESEFYNKVHVGFLFPCKLKPAASVEHFE